jgi:hypothetical protein
LKLYEQSSFQATVRFGFMASYCVNNKVSCGVLASGKIKACKAQISMQQ